ncbi:hypothetical protein [Flavitalea sp.]|nr:hypothetical protein [Flavitalea sp.]
MKRFFTLAALFISMVSFAAAPPRAGRIIINNGDYNNIVVRINGRSYNVDQQTLILNNLVGGRHHLEVYKTEKKPFGFGRSKPVLIFSSAIYVDPSFIVDVNINRFGKVSIGKSVIVKNGNDRYDNNRYDNDRYDDDRDGRSIDDRYNDNSGPNDKSNDGKRYDDKTYPDNGNGNRPARF